MLLEHSPESFQYLVAGTTCMKSTPRGTSISKGQVPRTSPLDLNHFEFVGHKSQVPVTSPCRCTINQAAVATYSYDAKVSVIGNGH